MGAPTLSNIATVHLASHSPRCNVLFIQRQRFSSSTFIFEMALIHPREAELAQSSRSRELRWGAIHAQALAPSRIHDPACPLPLMLPSSRSSSSRLFRAVFALQGRGFLELGVPVRVWNVARIVRELTVL